MGKPDFQKKIDGDFIECEIFKATVAMDGRFSELSQEERNNFTKEIFKNTQTHILNSGISLPVKDGHFDKSQETKGYVISLKLKRKNVEDLGVVYSLWAKMFLFEPYFNLYKSGRYPGISVEISPEGYLENGTKFKSHLAAVALCGVDMAAFPLLEQEFASNSINFFSMVGPKDYSIKKSQFKKDKFMASKEEILGKLKEVYDLIDSMEDSEEYAMEEDKEKEKEKMAEEVIEEEEEKVETKKHALEEKDKDKIKEEYRKLNQSKIELNYEKLAFAGKIGKDQKLNFTKIAETAGLETAISIYSSMESRKPSLGSKISSENNTTSISKDRMDSINKLSRNNAVLKLALIEQAKKEGN